MSESDLAVTYVIHLITMADVKGEGVSPSTLTGPSELIPLAAVCFVKEENLL